MKRFLILATALLMACSAEEDEMNLVKPKSPVRFYAEVEGLGSRTQLDAKGLTCWNADDRITIYTGETYNREFAFDGEDGAPSGGYDQVSIDKTFYSAYDVDANYAIYPHQASNQLKPYSTSDPSQGGYFVATLPAEQTYVENSFGRGAFTMVAVTQDVSDGRLIFKNVGGCIVLSLYGADQPIVRVTVEGNKAEKLAGKAHVAHKNGGLPTTTMQSTATTSVSVVSESGIAIGTTAETATEFWLAVPPTTFEQGFTITVEGADGITYTKSTSKKQSVERNVFLMMPAIEVDFWGEGSSVLITENQKLLYTTTDGNPLSFSEGYTMGEATLVSHTYTNGQGVMVFNKEITSINGYMFYGNETLQTITLPSTLKEIEMLAFWRCSNLQNVTLPEGLETLGMGAFTGCESITSVTLPESLTYADENLFRNCASLVEFKGKFASGDGRCLIIDGVLNSFAPANLTTYAIPEGVVRVGEDSFNGCANLTSVTIPEGVEELGNWVFWQCTALTSIEIPASITQIGQQCFGGCTLLSAIYCNPTTPPALELFDGSWRAFEDIAEGAKIYVPAESVEAYKTADGWSDYADMICAQSQPANEIWYTSTDGNIVEPYDVTVFGATLQSNTYSNGKGVITFDGPVTEVGKYAFKDLVNLVTIIIPEQVTKIGDSAFYKCENLFDVAVPSGVNTIDFGAFCACSNLTNITMPNSLTSLGALAFNGCKSLTNIIIPEGITSIKYDTFFGCYNLTTINIPNSVECIESNAFYGCNLTNVNIPDGVNSIGEEAFYGCDNLENMVLGSGIVSISGNAFYGCTGNLVVNCNIPNAASGPESAFYNSKFTSITIEDGVTSIGNFAFFGNENTKDVIISNGVTKIGDAAFCGCDFESIRIPDSVTSIGMGAFSSCGELVDVRIPDKVEVIKEYTFLDCSSLTSVTIGAGITTIEDKAFYRCTGLKNIFFRSNIPPTRGAETFYAAFDFALYVPESDDDSIINAYKVADGWSGYADKMVEYEF